MRSLFRTHLQTTRPRCCAIAPQDYPAPTIAPTDRLWYVIALSARCRLGLCLPDLCRSRGLQLDRHRIDQPQASLAGLASPEGNARARSQTARKDDGRLRNPLGAMALYLGSTLYRIHGANDVKSIGQAQSSGCFAKNALSCTSPVWSMSERPSRSYLSLPETPALSQVQPRLRPAPAEYTRRDYRDLRDSVLGARP